MKKSRFGAADIEGAPKPARRQESGRNLPGVWDFRTNIL